MGTPDFAVPTLIEIVGRGHEVAAVYTRAPKPAGRGMELQVTPVEREARRFGIPVLTPKTLRSDEAIAEFRAHKADAAVVVAYGLILPGAGARSGAARLLQPARLAAAALARRRADQPRRHGGRRGKRRDGDADGGGARYRADRAGRARADRRRHDGGRTARRAGAARRRPDGARARRAGARHAAAHAAAGRRRHLRGQDRQGRDADRLGASRGKPCTIIAAGCRRFPAPGSSCRAPAASRCCARRAARAPARPARCWTTG